MLFYLHELFIAFISSKVMYLPWIDSSSLKSFGFWWGSMGYAYKMPTYRHDYFSDAHMHVRRCATFVIFPLFRHRCLPTICIHGCLPNKMFQGHQLGLQGSTKCHWFPELSGIIWWGGCGKRSWKYPSISQRMTSYDKYILIGIKLIIHFPLHQTIRL